MVSHIHKYFLSLANVCQLKYNRDQAQINFAPSM